MNDQKMTPTQIEAVLDAEVAVRNAMVQLASTNMYSTFAKMQRKLLRIARKAEAGTLAIREAT